MPITTHVTSLELSRRLKELRVPQRSFFKWGNICIDGQYHWSLYVPPEYNKVPNPALWVHGISAYLASELGEFIGNSLDNGEDKDIPKELQTTSIQDIWKPDYLAKLLIWLLENHLISVEELGK